MTRWKKKSARTNQGASRPADEGDQCVGCFAIAWLHEHDHGREFEPLVENLTGAIEASGYQVWRGSRDTLDAFLRDHFNLRRGWGNQRHVAVATAAIERSWQRGQLPV